MTNEQKYQIMIQENPQVLSLVEELELVNPETGLPYGVQAVPDDRRRKLSEIAERVLNKGRIYTCEQVISLIETKLNIPRQRAVNGFEMMMNTGVLTQFSGTGVRLTM